MLEKEMLRIRTLSLAAAALALGSAASAFAADLTYEPAAAPLATTPAFTWTGPYLGAILGYGWGNFNVNSGFTASSPNADGAKLGGFGGYNFDLGNNIVLGAEADLNWDNLSGNYGPGGSVKQNWDSTARLRAGYSFGRVLAYGTGGAAVTGATVDSGAMSTDSTHWGWTLGAGVEAAVTDHIIARVEYQYADFGKEFYQTGLGTGANADLNTNTIRAGVGYKF
jgi:outer membrane immunogenic protein